jgi:hypothetical protein
VKKTHDYIHRYRGYWSDGGRCRIRIILAEDRPHPSATLQREGHGRCVRGGDVAVAFSPTGARTRAGCQKRS